MNKWHTLGDPFLITSCANQFLKTGYGKREEAAFAESG